MEVALEVRKAQIIRAAINVFGLDGVSGTTLPRVAAEAGVSSGLINLHFETKENLLKECIVTLTNDKRLVWSKSRVKAGRSPQQLLFDLMLASFDPILLQETSLSAWYVFFGEARTKNIAASGFKEHDAERKQVQVGLLSWLIDDQGYTDMDPPLVHTMLESLIDGQVYMTFWDKAYSVSEAISVILMTLSLTFPKHYSRDLVL